MSASRDRPVVDLVDHAVRSDPDSVMAARVDGTVAARRYVALPRPAVVWRARGEKLLRSLAYRRPHNPQTIRTLQPTVTHLAYVTLPALLIDDGWAVPWSGRGAQPSPPWPREVSV